MCGEGKVSLQRARQPGRTRVRAEEGKENEASSTGMKRVMDKRQRACQIWMREEEDARAGRRRRPVEEVGAVNVGGGVELREQSSLRAH